MKHLLGILLFALSFTCINVTQAQTQVKKINPEFTNDGGVVYSLPKTSLVIHANITKYTYKAGPYFRYAEKYLGIKDPVTKDHTLYKLEDVRVLNEGIPDPNNTYLITFKKGTTAPFVYLTEEGLLCSINAEYSAEESELQKARKKVKQEKVRDVSVFSEELILAGSISKQAEVAAKQIYRIRESRMNILTGEADNLPPDGEAMKIVIQQLEEEERALTNLFAGVITKQQDYYETTIEPSESPQRIIAFRFSDLRGALPSDDLGGTPIYLKTTPIQIAPQLTEKELAKKMKSLKGVVYNVPGSVMVELSKQGEILFQEELPVAQFGTKQSLTKQMFENDKAPIKVYFIPETGALKQIIQ